MPIIRPMSISTDLEIVAGLIYDTDVYLFPFLFGAREKALPILRKLVELDDNSFSHQHIQVAASGGEVQAILIGYDHRKIDPQAEAANFKRVLPVWDQLLMVPKFWILRPFMDKSDVTGNYIQNVCVASNARGQGLGSALIRDFCLSHATDIWLDVELGNKGALSLYQRLGFRIASKKTIFLPGLGSYRMVRPVADPAVPDASRVVAARYMKE